MSDFIYRSLETPCLLPVTFHRVETHSCSGSITVELQVINLCGKGKRKPSQTNPYSTAGTETPLPTRSSCPKTVFSPRAEQFHLPYRNWYWHSLIPICAPSPITMMASGRLWQIARCRGARPGILLQIILAPKATTDDKALKKKAERHVITELRRAGAAVWLVGCCAKGEGSEVEFL